MNSLSTLHVVTEAYTFESVTKFTYLAKTITCPPPLTEFNLQSLSGFDFFSGPKDPFILITDPSTINLRFRESGTPQKPIPKTGDLKKKILLQKYEPMWENIRVKTQSSSQHR